MAPGALTSCAARSAPPRSPFFSRLGKIGARMGARLTALRRFGGGRRDRLSPRVERKLFAAIAARLLQIAKPSATIPKSGMLPPSATQDAALGRLRRLRGPALRRARASFLTRLGFPPGHVHVLSADARAPAFSPFRFFSLDIFLFTPIIPPRFAPRGRGRGGRLRSPRLAVKVGGFWRAPGRLAVAISSQ